MLIPGERKHKCSKDNKLVLIKKYCLHVVRETIFQIYHFEDNPCLLVGLMTEGSNQVSMVGMKRKIQINGK